MFKKRLFAAVLTAAMIIGALSFTALSGTAGDVEARLIQADARIYAGGVFNMSAYCSDPDAVYKWVCWYDYDHYVELPDNDGYHGTDTPHFSFTATEGKANDKDWGYLRFGCKMTVRGKTYLTDTYSMHILSKEQLRKDLEKDGYGVSGFGLSGKKDYEEVDGVRYYTVPADEKISFTFSFGIPRESYYEESEVTVATEVFVTENGQTKMMGPLDNNVYTPYTIGKGAVKARVDYVVYINGVRFMVTDSKQLVINTVVPRAESEAEAKSGSSIYKDRYEQSFRIGYVEKGSRVMVLENYGTWSKVAAGGIIGYMPNYALNIYDTIGVVEIFAQEPCHLAPASFDVRLGGDKYRLWDGEDAVTWYDKTTGQYLKEGDLFNKKHVYALDIWVEAGGGKVFRATADYKLDVNASLNGEALPVNTAYEQVYNKVLSAYKQFDHIHDLKKQVQKNPTCETEGMLTYWYCSCGAKFADYAGTERITDPEWGVIPARGHRESEWKSDGKQHYKFCLRRDCEADLYYLRGDHTGGQATCRSQAVCEICGLPYGELGGHVYSEDWNLKTKNGHAHKCIEPSCQENTGIYPHTPGPEATDDQPQVCLDCGYVLAWPASYNPFDDIPDNSWYTEAALWCNSKGYITGTSANMFSPKMDLTRAMFIQILARVAIGKGLDDLSYHGHFKDVPANKWYAKAVQWAIDNKVTDGTGPDTFSPDMKVTREQLATFFIAYSRANGFNTEARADISGYEDESSVSRWALDAVRWAVAEELISGTSKTTLSPRATANRAQAAVIFKKYVEVYTPKQNS